MTMDMVKIRALSCFDLFPETEQHAQYLGADSGRNHGSHHPVFPCRNPLPADGG
jgi:hypothetical protein